MKLLVTLFIAVFLLQHANSQYYYNEVVVLKETNKHYLALKNAHINLVTAQNFENDNTPTPDFALKQQMNRSATELTITSDIPAGGHSETVNSYSNNQLVKTVEDVVNIQNSVTYTYDAAGNVKTVTTSTIDTLMASNANEVDEWFYTGNVPAYMLHIKDKVDTTVVEFVKDERGNIAEEHWKKKGKKVENYFYYYNNANLLTDIVRFNNVARRLLPDFLFEYNESGYLTQLTQIQQNAGSYLTWRYEYNSNNLKQKETCFDKQKQLVGYIVYNYR